MSPRVMSMTIFVYCGIWRPEEWRSGWKFLLYNIYTAIIIFFVFTIPLAQCIDLFTTAKYDDTTVNNIDTMMMMIYECGKIVTMLAYRQRIIKLLSAFGSGICQAKNSNEEALQETRHRLIRYGNRAYTLLIVVTIVGISITYLTLRIPKKDLPYNIWLPFIITTDSVYGLMFAYEWFAQFMGAVIAIGFDTFLFETILRLCTQFDTLKCRIRSIDTIPTGSLNENELEYSNGDQDTRMNSQIVDCVRHHLFIYELADEANRIFCPVILLNYLTNAMVICTCVYEISRIDRFTFQLVSLLVYISTYISEIFWLCYIGSKLIDESQNVSQVIYDIQWQTLSRSDIKSIHIMMIRSSKPVMFTGGKIFHLCVGSAVKLVQFAYSAYTCLKQISN